MIRRFSGYCRKVSNVNGFFTCLFSLVIGQLHAPEFQGEVKAIICCGGLCKVIPDSGEFEMETVEGAKMDVKVYFFGGKEPKQWQQAQLFRTNLNSSDRCFRVKAYLE